MGVISYVWYRRLLNAHIPANDTAIQEGA